MLITSEVWHISQANRGRGNLPWHCVDFLWSEMKCNSRFSWRGSFLLFDYLLSRCQKLTTCIIIILGMFLAYYFTMHKQVKEKNKKARTHKSTLSLGCYHGTSFHSEIDTRKCPGSFIRIEAIFRHFVLKIKSESNREIYQIAWHSKCHIFGQTILYSYSLALKNW